MRVPERRMGQWEHHLHQQRPIIHQQRPIIHQQRPIIHQQQGSAVPAGWLRPLPPASVHPLAIMAR